MIREFSFSFFLCRQNGGRRENCRSLFAFSVFFLNDIETDCKRGKKKGRKEDHPILGRGRRRRATLKKHQPQSPPPPPPSFLCINPKPRKGSLLFLPPNFYFTRRSSLSDFSPSPSFLHFFPQPLSFLFFLFLLG